MFKRVTFLTAAVLPILLLAGCGGTLGPAPEQTPIRFEAGSLLLLDDGMQQTKAGTPKDAFAVSDKFFVWSAKTIASTRYAVFSGQPVTLQSLGANPADPADDLWTYNPLRFWDSNASQYDFLAISGPTSAAGITCNPTASGPLTAQVPYNSVENQCDIVAAAHHRANGVTDKVHMHFYHILSAVSFVIYNDSPSIDITLNSYTFRDIVTSSIGTITQEGNDGLAPMLVSHWDSPGANGGNVLGYNEGAQVIEHGEHFPTTTVWDIMVPQDLEPYSSFTPRIFLNYEYDHTNPYTGQEHVTNSFGINLEEIQAKNSSDFITSWEPGKKYTYEIHVRLGGGVNVTVNVTDWEEVPAETPGVTILQ